MLHKHRQTNTEATSRIIQNIIVPKIWQYRDCTKETIEITRTKQINRIEHERHKHKTLAV